MQISNNAAVQIHYTLTNSAGETLDSSIDSTPLAYLQGAGNIISGLEKALDGKAVGDTFVVSVPPEEAYGVHEDAKIETVPRSAFQGVAEIEPGMQFQAQSPMGPLIVTVTEVGDDEVTIDGNHPLAGETLTFDVEVVEVREATAEELAHGHVHGPGGHHHD
ncbi:MAG: peptidylprolyl isomerase [Pseudomonadota bacterium]